MNHVRLIEKRDDGRLHLLGPAWQEDITDSVELQSILRVLDDGQPRTVHAIWLELDESPSRSTIDRRVRGTLVPKRMVEVVCHDPFTVRKRSARPLSAPTGGETAGSGGLQ